MNVNKFPYEILSAILEAAAEQNKRDGVQFTYGLSQAPIAHQQVKVQRYVRGQRKPDQLNWDATWSIRQTCSLWHHWALKYSMKNVFVKRWLGGERWVELPDRPTRYNIYELIEGHRGEYASKKPFETLFKTRDVLTSYPNLASHVRRLWFHGFLHAHTDRAIFDILHACSNVETVTVPWITLRHLAAEEWAEILGKRNGTPLRALEFLAEDMNSQQTRERGNDVDLQPLLSPLVDFSNLRKLKIFGDTTFMPITDTDLMAIAKTATQLEEFYLTCLSTISIDGVMAIVKSSQKTLRVLEHAPRSNEGFWHPHPGHHNQHVCEILVNCPRLKTVSLSMPSMCPALFSNPDVLWEGDFQVRSTRICGYEDCPRSFGSHDMFQKVLSQARKLSKAKRRGSIPRDLAIELFFADFIFEPHLSLVHGDFQLAELSSGGLWPTQKESSTKGPYGSSGLYEKEEEVFEKVDESHFLQGLKAHYVSV